MSAETEHPTPETGRYRCVIDGCAWVMVDPNVRTDLPDGRVIAAPGETLLETVARARSRAVERELRLHLESHDLTEFVATIMRLRDVKSVGGPVEHPVSYFCDRCGDVGEVLQPTTGASVPCDCPAATGETP